MVKLSDWISLAGIIIAMIAAVVSTFVLLQMQEDTEIARRDSELRIQPVLFVKDLNLNINNDDVLGIDIIVINSGLGPALNVSAAIAEDVALPGSSAAIKKEVFERSQIIQVLPHANSATGNVTSNIFVSDSASLTLAGGISGVTRDALQSSSTIRIPLAKRPDGQTALRLRSLGVTKDELEGALKDALFITKATSMTNTPVSYKNRPKRSDTIQEVK